MTQALDDALGARTMLADEIAEDVVSKIVPTDDELAVGEIARLLTPLNDALRACAERGIDAMLLVHVIDETRERIPVRRVSVKAQRVQNVNAIWLVDVTEESTS